MIRINNVILTNIFLYVILPITLMVVVIISLILLKNHKLTSIKKTLLFLKTVGIIFTIYFIYTLIWSILELIALRKYNVLKESKMPIILWIILPICPAIIAFILWNKYKFIKEIGDKDDKTISSN